MVNLARRKTRTVSANGREESDDWTPVYLDVPHEEAVEVFTKALGLLHDIEFVRNNYKKEKMADLIFDVGVHIDRVTNENGGLTFMKLQRGLT
jgi:hypothetical protein